MPRVGVNVAREDVGLRSIAGDAGRSPAVVDRIDQVEHLHRLVTAPLRCHYALELPSGAILASRTEVGDYLDFTEEPEELDVAG